MIAHLLNLLFERHASNQVVDAPVNRNCRVHIRERLLLGNDPQRNHQYDRKGKRAPDPKHVHEQAYLTDLLLCILLLCQRKSANHVIIPSLSDPARTLVAHRTVCLPRDPPSAATDESACSGVNWRYQA